MTRKLSNITLITIAIFVGGCKPSEPSPNLAKTQREAFDNAKDVERQVQQGAQERKQAADAASQ